MARSGFKITPRGARNLLTSRQTQALILDHANRALRAAKASAPVRTGRYRDSLHIETDITDRFVARVIADAPYSVIVEANDGVLKRAIQAAR